MIFEDPKIFPFCKLCSNFCHQQDQGSYLDLSLSLGNKPQQVNKWIYSSALAPNSGLYWCLTLVVSLVLGLPVCSPNHIPILCRVGCALELWNQLT